MKQQGLRILLVEDDDDHAHLILRNLQHTELGENIVERVSDGDSALKYLLQKPPFENASRPDLILLDLKLPKVDGHQVLQSMNDVSELKVIPTVVMTTSDAEADRMRAYELNANSYVVKPIDFGQFKQMILDFSRYWAKWNRPVPKVER